MAIRLIGLNHGYQLRDYLKFCGEFEHFLSIVRLSATRFIPSNGLSGNAFLCSHFRTRG